jgi:regulator of protease activity HflC (stomatin/prohibitin superfamily)
MNELFQTVAGFRLRKRYLAGAAAAIIGLYAYNNCIAYIEPSERGGLRVWSQVASDKPLQPGRYLKIPFYSEIDEITVALQTVHVKPFMVNTVDNQRVTLEINISYTIPDSAVFHLLYGVGRAGGGDISGQVEQIVKDRVSRVYSSKNTNFLAKDREEIQAEITRVVHEELNRMFKIDVESLQIAATTYSPAFQESNDLAVLEKNKAVAAENKVRTIELEAKQKVAEAEGMAKQKVAQAEGANKSAILAAQADARKVELESEAAAKARMLGAKAEADATVLQATADRQARELRGVGDGLALSELVKAMGGPEKYVALITARGLANWKGEVPGTVIGGTAAGANQMMPLILPQTALGTPAK